jgi:hypothetical protein
MTSVISSLEFIDVKWYRIKMTEGQCECQGGECNVLSQTSKTLHDEYFLLLFITTLEHVVFMSVILVLTWFYQHFLSATTSSTRFRWKYTLFLTHAHTLSLFLSCVI